MSWEHHILLEAPLRVVRVAVGVCGGSRFWGAAVRVLWRRLATVPMAAMSMASCGAAADGYFLRAGIGVDRPAEAAFMDIDCASTSPAALYGCGRGGDGTPRRSVGEFGTVAAAQLGLGYAVASSLRLEVVAAYNPRLAFDGHANFLQPGRQQAVQADVSSLTAMFAVHIDLDQLGVPMLGPFKPFVGVGLGAARTRIEEMRMTFPRTTTIVPSGRGTDTVWMLTAGLAAMLQERTTLDLAWRYADLGEVWTGRGAGQVVWRDGSREPLHLDLAATQARLKCHGLRLSLRYGL